MTNGTNFTNSSYGNLTEDLTAILQRLNANEAAVLLPVTIYVLFLMMAGIVGNSIVIYVYKFRFRRSSSRVFILCLALLDLVTCTFGIPFHTLDLNFPFLFTWDFPCKVLCYLLTCTIFSSVFILVLISIERYRKICLPFKRQISDIGTKRICLGCVFVSVVLSIPVLLFYGISSVEMNVLNVTAYECFISDDYRDSIYPIIFDGVSIIIFLTSTCTLIILYTKIGVTVWKKGTFQGRKSNVSRSCCDTSENPRSTDPLRGLTSENPDLIPMHSFVQQNATNQIYNSFDEYSNVLLKSPPLRKDHDNVNRNSRNIKRNTQMKKENRKCFNMRKSVSEESSSESFTSTVERRSQAVRRTLHLAGKFSRKQRRSLRITFMLTLITVVFILSFLPYLVISITSGFDENFWRNLTPSETLLYNFLLRTYFVNNMANPLIYGFLDEKFRLEVKKIFRCCMWKEHRFVN